VSPGACLCCSLMREAISGHQRQSELGRMLLPQSDDAKGRRNPVAITGGNQVAIKWSSPASSNRIEKRTSSAIGANRTLQTQGQARGKRSRRSGSPPVGKQERRAPW
jgi:hypothetical protein